ncbi:MAG TPA: ATP-binding protein [Acidobacteriaceae bacterium]|jgi:signal transduction histidine kinase/HAMP domain-containing protein|nr:ATP-binding protein [Acidobacteriaceae bacterium]
MRRRWPRSIRFQLLIGLVLLEALSLLLLATILTRQQNTETRGRAKVRLEHQASSLEAQVLEALQNDRPEAINTAVRIMADSPSVDSAKIADPNGIVLFDSAGLSVKRPLAPAELAELKHISGNDPYFFAVGPREWEGAKAIRFQGKLYGYSWVKTDEQWDKQQVSSLLRAVTIFGVIWIGASLLLSWGLARSITGPLAVLHRGTRALMHSPDGESQFPLPVTVHNEIGELLEAFNRMVASIEEQRAGLSDTLSLLDSMLANAPIGLAFFDRRARFVRVNRIFADISGIPLSRHLGRTLPEVLPAAVASQLETNIFDVFENDRPLRDMEVSGINESTNRPWSWITSAYPIHTTPEQVRWVGLIVMDASDRKRGEEALRKTEKLAATGRLAASIAHEINNPLEAITNLLYLLNNHAQLEEPARSYVTMAEHEVRRISEITQQTLRFYRQSTLPARAQLSELLDSVLSLHQGRLRNLGITVEKGYDSNTSLYCFAGELRQVFANLIGNAIDAMQGGGRLVLRARRSRSWSDTSKLGVRFQVADTGSGMTPEVRKHIFEPFYTTKEVTGTGLGLWVSSEIVSKHSGSMRVRSHSDTLGGPSGTIFELFFPDEPEVTSLAENEPSTVSTVS